MVDVWVEAIDGVWFAVAFHDRFLVATAVRPTRDEVVSEIMRNIPSPAPRRMVEMGGDFAHETARMLAWLEAGDERNKSFTLSEEYLSGPIRTALLAASAIPIGYVTTYGNIGIVSGLIARTVGRLMATNPLYPVVPCHRVVGSDMSLVGYGGKQDYPALRSKLDRLRGEARGCAPTKLPVAGGSLTLYPAEWVIYQAERTLVNPDSQLTLF